MATDNPNVPLNPVRVKLDMQGGRALERQSPSKGEGMYALAIAKVVRVDYEAMEVTLLVMIGEEDFFQRVPIPLTFPGAGPRHFLGAMPECGSFCVIGYIASQPHKIPIVLSWVVPGAQMGYDWIPTQEFQPEEFDFNKRRRTELEGMYDRFRRKLRHMSPGNIVASSSQGSDLVLDESVLLTNRRANEIRIRDQDQAIITRSLQKFDVQGGVRVYSGMVQRDASLLPLQVFSDGIDWGGYRQRVGNVPLPPELLDPERRIDEGGFLPNDVFYRESDGGIPESGMDFGDDIDPYGFLVRGLFISRDGYIRDPELTLDGATYGGKRMFRTSFDPTSDPNLRRVNSITETDDDESATLTEHRTEVMHTWNGTLPVSEQTEGFDADRIPGAVMDETNDLLQNEQPMVMVVYGSVVGNDPFSDSGKELYGVPLRPIIFDDDGNGAPALVSGLGEEVNSHAASLFKVDPPLLTDVFPTFFSVTKGGQVRASIGGSGSGNSLELTAVSSMKIQAGGPITFEAVGGVRFINRGGEAQGNLGYDFTADTGGVRVSAGGPITEGNVAAAGDPEAGSPSQAPHLHLDASGPNGNVHVTANRDILIAAKNSIQLDRANTVDITPKTMMRLLTDKFSIQVKTVDKTVMGQCIELYSGPVNFLPTNAPLRKVTFAGTPLTGHIGGNTDEYKMVFGDRKETFLIGSHETNIVIGDMTYSTFVGTVTHRAGVNQSALGFSSGLQVNIPVGVMTMLAVAAASFKGVASVQVSSGGPAIFSGSVCTLGGAGKVGGIVCQTDIDPLSGLPLGFLGLGSPGHVLSAPVP